jgi:hypothetical protein
VERLQGCRFDRKEIAGQHLQFVVPEKGAPIAAFALLRRRNDSRLLQNALDGCAVDGVAQLEQFAFDPFVTPVGVFVRQADNQPAQRSHDWWSAHSAVVLDGPLESHQLTMPVQECLRLENQNLGKLRSRSFGRLPELGEQHGQQTLFPSARTWKLSESPFQHLQL